MGGASAELTRQGVASCGDIGSQQCSSTKNRLIAHTLTQNYPHYSLTGRIMTPIESGIVLSSHLITNLIADSQIWALQF